MAFKITISLVVILYLISLLTGCSEIPVNQNLNPDTFYRRDMVLEVDGIKGDGTMVAPYKTEHSFKVVSAGDLDLFTLETCHRDWTKERAWKVVTKKRLFWKKKIEKKREVDFTYKPTELEKGYCPIKLGGYDKSNGRHSWAFIDFKTPGETLQADVQCNGDQYKSTGVSVCQSRKGLKQVITFPVVVQVKPAANCSLGKVEGKVFKFNIAGGRCVYAFMEKGGARRVHRLTTLGYESILIRSP